MAAASSAVAARMVQLVMPQILLSGFADYAGFGRLRREGAWDFWPEAGGGPVARAVAVLCDGLLESHDEGGCGSGAGALVAVDGGCVEVDGVAGFYGVGGIAVADFERAREDVEKLAAEVLVGARLAAGLGREELGEVGVKLAV